MAGFASRNSGYDEGSTDIMAEINITPLTDIFLVLLIIFMVTSSVMSQMGVDVNLPHASQAASQSPQDGVIITLLPHGGMKVNTGGEISPGSYGDLEKQVGAAFQKTQSRTVILEGDRQAFLGSAIEVIDHAKRAGADHFSIAAASDIR